MPLTLWPAHGPGGHVTRSTVQQYGHHQKYQRLRSLLLFLPVVRFLASKKKKQGQWILPYYFHVFNTTSKVGCTCKFRKPQKRAFLSMPWHPPMLLVTSSHCAMHTNSAVGASPIATYHPEADTGGCTLRPSYSVSKAVLMAAIHFCLKSWNKWQELIWV